MKTRDSNRRYRRRSGVSSSSPPPHFLMHPLLLSLLGFSTDMYCLSLWDLDLF
ncbi:predicted protein [Arabidopsis lyrata subsp. lyrata]|uniref:Predicted protein n=1 Tax=Arabidopsis lyrata subsp. lyrata TaxID=81972 RepID=D7MKS5_ARALL|nr:predicted protein [Arabidopsis lyrata subsp. lyrata]